MWKRRKNLHIIFPESHAMTFTFLLHHVCMITHILRMFVVRALKENVNIKNLCVEMEKFKIEHT